MRAPHEVDARNGGVELECWLDAGIGKAMSQFNGVLDDPGKEE